MTGGLMIAAPASGSGKTLLTLALLRALSRRGLAVSSAKAGPDYIDPAFHAAASGRPSVNLDPYAMRAELVAWLAADACGSADAFVVEAMMGLFDGAADGSGSAADLALRIGSRIVLAIDCAKQSHSIGALVRGFATHRPDVSLSGLILNRVGSPRHARLLADALAPLGIPVLASLPRAEGLVLPERHLGLVQAGEHEALEAFLDAAADWLGAHADLDRLAALARPAPAPAARVVPLAPFGQRIAVARDTAFAFAYPHLLDGWRGAGAELSFFSPLADEEPDGEADAVYLPGGYPELHGGRLAEAQRFRAGMEAAAARGAAIYGECGGYMVLGKTLEDAGGACHHMLGLLPLETSFARRRLHLGYRRLTPLEGSLFRCSPVGHLVGHEFHYATIVREGEGERLFRAEDALGQELGTIGLRRGRVMGSFAHLIDRA